MKSLLLSILITGLALMNIHANNVNISFYNANTGIPDSIMKVLNKSCVGCHSKGGNLVAKGKVNFTKWEKYSAKKQSAKANAICDVMTENRMPPAGWKKNNEKLTPTKKEIESICKWVASLNTGK
jgi:mono/diheme cytochrome c family protein